MFSQLKRELGKDMVQCWVHLPTAKHHGTTCFPTCYDIWLLYAMLVGHVLLVARMWFFQCACLCRHCLREAFLGHMATVTVR